MGDCTSIFLSDLDLADSTYRITRAGEDVSALARSISAQGILTPPAVIEKDDPGTAGGKFTVVSGFRRLEAADSLGLTQVLCRVYTPEKAAACARLAVAENAFCRELGPGELVRAVILMSRHEDTATLADQSREIFNTRLNRHYMDSLIKIGRFAVPALDLLDSGQLSMKAAKALAAMPGEEAGLIVSLFSAIKASSGKQMEIITWAREIAAREGIGLDRLLNENDVRAALDPSGGNQDMNAAANRIRAFLCARRFPELDTARTRAAALVRELKLPKNIRMTLPENFESTVYGFSVNFSSPGDYAAAVKAMADIESHPSLHKLLNR